MWLKNKEKREENEIKENNSLYSNLKGGCLPRRLKMDLYWENSCPWFCKHKTLINRQKKE